VTPSQAPQIAPPQARASEAAAAERLWSERARAELRRAGCRRGGAREQLIDLLARERCALTVQEMDRRLREAHRRGTSPRPVGIASVYRGIELLDDLGLVSRVDIGDGIARYERAGIEQSAAAHGHHHHFVCDRCGVIVPFDDQALEQAIIALEDRVGFTVSGHEILLHGACSGCGGGRR
jgi:Fur family ferric uptake transcriptional regulator